MTEPVAQAPEEELPVIKNETEPEIIDAQITAGIAESGSAWGFLNNWILNLPEERYRRVHEDLGDMDTVPDPSEWDPDDPKYRSTKFMQSTPRQFFSDVDQAIQDSGIDLVELQRLGELRRLNTGDERRAYIEAYNRLSIPVYRQLRMLGYSHYDLTA